MFPCRIFFFVALTVAGVTLLSSSAMAQAMVPVTVYDQSSKPHTAYGTPDASGTVIVFDTAPIANPPAPTPFLAPAAAAEPGNPPAPELLPAAGAAPSQPDEASAPPSETGRYVDGVYLVNSDYLLSYPRNVYRILSAPTRFDRDDWLTAALVVGGAGALLMLDEPLRDFSQDNVRSGFTDNMSDVFREFGESRNILFGSLGAYAVAEALDSTGVVNAKREKAAALLTLESFAITQGLITGLKYGTGRNRPEDTKDGYDFTGPTTSGHSDSFPSGHAGNAFALASVLSAIYGPDNPWVPWVAYPIATGTALSRVNDNRHWFSDVFVGGAIGYFVGQLVVRYSPFLARNNLTLLPFDQEGARGVSMAYRF